MTKSSTLTLHKSLFNRNPDGTVMDDNDIQRVLNEKAIKWKSETEVYHNHCRRTLVVEHLRSKGFVCSEHSDNIEVWLYPGHSITVDYDQYNACYGRIKASSLDELTEAIIKKSISLNTVDPIKKENIQCRDKETKESGKTFSYTNLYQNTEKSSAHCIVQGIGDNLDEAFINSLESLVILGEQAKKFLNETK